jgi:hypothetical protein
MTRRSCVSLLLTLPALTAQQDAARLAAEKWLTLLDQARFKDAYKQSSQHSRAQATSPEWEAQIKAMRDAAGEWKSRKFSSAKPAKSLAGAPDGDYMLLEFSSVFANKPSAVESLMLSRESGTWKPAGYFIR